VANHRHGFLGHSALPLRRSCGQTPIRTLPWLVVRSALVQARQRGRGCCLSDGLSGQRRSVIAREVKRFELGGRIRAGTGDGGAEVGGRRRPDVQSSSAPFNKRRTALGNAMKSRLRAFQVKQRFSELGLDRWRAEAGLLDETERAILRRRERLFIAWKAGKGILLLPLSTFRQLLNLVFLLADVERLHGAPRRRMIAGRGCVIDRQTWLVNGDSIELGDHVKVSAFSALVAGAEAKIMIGDYTILGPGVFVVAANHGIAKDGGIPIRYQAWNEKPVHIGSNVWIGANAVILPGSRIGDGAVIGAGAVVRGEVPPGCIAYSRGAGLNVRERQ